MMETVFNLLAIWLLVAATSPLAFFMCCCDVPQCVTCEDPDFGSYEMEIIIAGVTTQSCPPGSGTTCSNLNRTAIGAAFYSWPGSVNCQFPVNSGGTVTSACSSTYTYFARVFYQTGTDITEVYAEVRRTNGGTAGTWQDDISGKIDCSDGVVSRSIPLTSDSDPACDFSAATCTLTLLPP